MEWARWHSCLVVDWFLTSNHIRTGEVIRECTYCRNIFCVCALHHCTSLSKTNLLWCRRHLKFHRRERLVDLNHIPSHSTHPIPFLLSSLFFSESDLIMTLPVNWCVMTTATQRSHLSSDVTNAEGGKNSLYLWLIVFSCWRPNITLWLHTSAGETEPFYSLLLPHLQQCIHCF